ncbi:hypothetical protein CEXT_72071 [Caerostris extrusa]|uniref:Uncharacterized protein n=1 Tax=Caerostris extrusa TaxID=172846 RepID=A0AAV4NDW8_CAEEX|nr:hypothetical protein CEXT_72071 [Caerostris extrusa]
MSSVYFKTTIRIEAIAHVETCRSLSPGCTTRRHVYIAPHLKRYQPGTLRMCRWIESFSSNKLMILGEACCGNIPQQKYYMNLDLVENDHLRKK